MFVKNGQPIDGNSWITYSYDGSNTQGSMVETQCANATSAQLVRMGVTVQLDPPVAPPTPASPTQSNPLAFRQLLTPAELTSITTLGQTNAQVRLFLDNTLLARTFDLSDQWVKDGMASIVAAGGLSQARADAILKRNQLTG